MTIEYLQYFVTCAIFGCVLYGALMLDRLVKAAESLPDCMSDVLHDSLHDIK